MKNWQRKKVWICSYRPSKNVLFIFNWRIDDVCSENIKVHTRWFSSWPFDPLFRGHQQPGKGSWITTLKEVTIADLRKVQELLKERYDPPFLFQKRFATLSSLRNTVASSKDKRGIVIDLKQPVEEKRDLEQEKNGRCPRDPGSPKLGMGAWKLSTLRFEGDCIPLHHPLTGWDRIPRVG